jgi:hypothetical protein
MLVARDNLFQQLPTRISRLGFELLEPSRIVFLETLPMGSKYVTFFPYVNLKYFRENEIKQLYVPGK